MVCCMFSAKKVSKPFWTEAVNWTFYLLNRCPMLVVKNVTPQEAWSGVKPLVEHLRVWDCLAHVHIPEAKRGKLDDKSFPCILFDMSDESKGYRLFDPKTKRIVVSKDVMFEEEKSWNQGPNYKEQIKAELVWGDDDFSSDKSEGEHRDKGNSDRFMEDMEFDSEGENDGICDSRERNEAADLDRRICEW